MILETFNKRIEIDSLEELTKLSNADRLALFGTIYPNSIVKSYGELNHNESLNNNMLKMLSDTIIWADNIKAVLKEILKSNDYITKFGNAELGSLSDIVRDLRLREDKDTITKRIYNRDNVSQIEDLNKSLASSVFDNRLDKAVEDIIKNIQKNKKNMTLQGYGVKFQRLMLGNPSPPTFPQLAFFQNLKTLIQSIFWL